MIRSSLVTRRAAPLLAAAMLGASAYPVHADALLEESLNFSGAITFLASGVPGLVIAGVRNGETAVVGFGEIAKGTGKEPGGDTILRVGSLSKVFCGVALAELVADGTLAFTDKLQDRLGYDVTLPEKDGRAIRLIDLVTHAAGLPREVPREEGPVHDPFVTNSEESQIAALSAADPLLFPPGTGMMYSNFGFDLLGAALAHASGKPYAALLEERIFAPLGMKDSRFNPRPEDQTRLMHGHNVDGSPMTIVPTPASIECAGGLYTTPNDMIRWIKWHLDRDADADSEVRLLDHAAYMYRDGMDPVVGLDEGIKMDAMGLGWIILMPDDHRPLIMHKSGGLQGNLAFVGLAPTRGVGVFFAMNEFNLPAFAAAEAAAIDLIAQLAGD